MDSAKGEFKTFPFSGPIKYSLTSECAPSAPMSREAVCCVPSANVAVTPGPEIASKSTRRLPYFSGQMEIVSPQDHMGVCETHDSGKKGSISSGMEAGTCDKTSRRPLGEAYLDIKAIAEHSGKFLPPQS